MSELAKKARNAMRDKISRLMRTDPKAKVDGSSFVPPEPLDADVKTGLRPVSRRQFKKGGKVVMMGGKPVKFRADRKGRKNGGSAPATPDNIINRDVKEANEAREGKKHVGGMKKGGKAQHEDVKMDKALIKKMVHKHEAAKHPGKPMTKLKRGGYAKKAGGGYMNGGTPPAPPKPPQMPEHVANDYNAWKVSQEVKREESASKKPTPPPPKKARGGSLDGSLQGTRPTGGRLAKENGGEIDKYSPWSKEKTNAYRDSLPMGARDDKQAQKKKAASSRKMADYLNEQDRQERSFLKASGGRLARKSGGRTKKKGSMNVNIVIGTGRDGQQPMPMPRGPMPPAGIPIPVGAPPPAGGPPMGPPPMMAGAPPMGPPPGLPMGGPGGMPPMPRKTGGRAIGVDKPGRVGHRTYRSASDMDAGAASALGRLEKIQIQKHKK